MQERRSDTPGPGPGAPESDDEAFEQVRERVQALISAARTLSDTCADLADALRPAVPGHAGDDPLIAGFGRLRAERTAALLDEAASAARGTLGLLHSAYGALDRGPRLGPPAPRSGATTWPDAFVEVPPRAFTVDDEAGTALERRPAGRILEADATDPHGIPAITGTALGPTPDGQAERTTTPDEPAVEEAELGTPAVEEAELGTPAAEETGLGTAPDQPAVEEAELRLGAAPDEPAAEEAGPATAPDEADPAEEDLGSDNFEGLRGWASEPESAGEPDVAQSPVPGAVEPEPAHATDPQPETDPEPDTAREPETAQEPETAREPETAAQEPETAREPQMAVQEPETAAQEPETAAQEPETAEGPKIAELVTAEAPETPNSETPNSETPNSETPNSETTPEPATPEPATPEPATPEPATAEAPEITDLDAPEIPADNQLPAVAAEPIQDDLPAAEHAAPEPPAAEQDLPAAEHAIPEPPATADSLPETTIAEIAEDAVDDDLEALDGEGLRSWATYAPRPTPGPAPADETPVSIGAHTRHDEPDEAEEADEPATPEDGYDSDEHSPADVDGEGLRSWATPPVAPTSPPEEAWTAPAQGTAPAQEAALAGWMVVDPDDEDDPGHPIQERTVAAAQSRPGERLTVGLDDPDGAGWHGDTVSAEPRSLSLVPPVPDESAEHRLPAEDPWASESAEDWSPAQDLSGAAAFARVESPVWAAEPAPGASVAGDGLAVFPISDPAPPAPALPAPAPEVLLEEPAAATISRQVEAARRHLQAALVVANGPSAPRLGALLTAVEQVLTAVTDLARETRGLLESGLADRTFPGEARFLCSPPWDGVALVGRDAYGDDGATPAGLAKLLRALGYEAHSATSAGGVSGVQIRAERYAMQVALVEPVGGGRQRWSGALEWVDAAGANRTWAETLGPVQLEDEELARRVDELLRRSIGSV